MAEVQIRGEVSEAAIFCPCAPQQRGERPILRHAFRPVSARDGGNVLASVVNAGGNQPLGSSHPRDLSFKLRSPR